VGRDGAARLVAARAYNASLALYNCLPSEPIGDRLAEFGGGVLMSATLEPMDVFREVTGLDHLEQRGRPVVERTYGLSFPPENRASFAVDAPKFTHQNRGAPGEENDTRLAHLDATVAVASREGNVLVGTPSYAEATWMAESLSKRLDKPVLLDESSGDRATESLKDDFFAGDGKVLVTSLRGTLTEGVDYRGDRLSAAVVCGVPIINTARPRRRGGDPLTTGGSSRDSKPPSLFRRSGRPGRPSAGSFVGRTNTEFASCSTPGTRA